MICPAEIIDRVAVTIDNAVITDSHIRDEIRVTAFLNGQAPDFSPDNRRKTADRLIEQELMRREMQFTRYPEPTQEDIREMLAQVVAREGGESGYRAALGRYGITGKQVEDALLMQAAVLRFIDLRFRPEVQVTEPEVMEFYTRVCVPELHKRNPNAPEPSFEEARSECEDLLVSQRVDERVEAWLKEARGRARIRYEDGAFQ